MSGGFEGVLLSIMASDGNTTSRLRSRASRSLFPTDLSTVRRAWLLSFVRRAGGRVQISPRLRRDSGSPGALGERRRYFVPATESHLIRFLLSSPLRRRIRYPASHSPASRKTIQRLRDALQFRKTPPWRSPSRHSSPRRT